MMSPAEIASKLYTTEQLQIDATVFMTFCDYSTAEAEAIMQDTCQSMPMQPSTMSLLEFWR